MHSVDLKFRLWDETSRVERKPFIFHPKYVLTQRWGRETQDYSSVKLITSLRQPYTNMCVCLCVIDRNILY